MVKCGNNNNNDIQVIEEVELPIREVDGVFLVIDNFEVINVSLMPLFRNIYMVKDVMQRNISTYKFYKVLTNNTKTYKLVKV